MKLSKIALAAAAFAAVASGSAFAGQIGSSSVTLATEVIYSDAQVVRAPSNVYSFAGNIDAQTNEQRLQLQYTLKNGAQWSKTVFPASALVAVPVQTAALVAPAVATGLLRVNYQDSTNATKAFFPSGTTVAGFVTGDRATLVLNVTIPAGAGNLLKVPSFTINADAISTSNENAGITSLFGVAGVAACPAPERNIDINFKHATTHNGTADIINQFTPDAEHLRGGSTNDARFINFSQNHLIKVTSALTNARTDAQFLNQRLNGANFTPVAAAPTVAGFADTFTAAATAPVTRTYLGSIVLSQRSNGLDTDYVNTYGKRALVPAVGTNTAAALEADDFSVASPATLENGVVEVAPLTITIALPAAFPAGTVVFLTNGRGTSITGQTVTTAANATSVVFTLASAADISTLSTPASVGAGGTGVAGAQVFADLPGNSTINAITGITATVAFNKVATGDNREQGFSCVGPLAGIGGGIKIDIRNYASRAKFPAGDYASYVRLINNSETVTADVYAQMIYANGTYGPYGQLPALAPRAVANYSNAQLEALLVTTPPTANPFGAASAYTQTQGTTVTAVGSAGIGDRVRFVSNTGTTLRIQSYLALPNGNLMDTSNAQGVDFENNTNNRAPTTDAMPLSQDAINGLAK